MIGPGLVESWTRKDQRTHIGEDSVYMYLYKIK